MAKEKKIITLGLDEKVIQALDKEKNKSKFINDLLLDYFLKKKETDKNDLEMMNDFLQELKKIILQNDIISEQNKTITAQNNKIYNLLITFTRNIK